MACQVRGSDGRERRELVKTNDDLRQDAVMQQFFGLIHRLLSDDPSAAARGLGLRTYRVQPLSPCAGLLQWVDHTMPLMDYLVGGADKSGGAHGRCACWHSSSVSLC